MFILNVAKSSNNEVNVCKSNPCKQKPLISDCSEHSAFNSFFSTVIAEFTFHTLLHVASC